MSVGGVIFLVIFATEAVVRSVANGFYRTPQGYLRDPWNKLDFAVLLFTTASVVLEAALLTGDSARTSSAGDTVGLLRTLRVLRVLRPLRLVSKSAGMRVIINALIATVPEAFNVIFLAACLFSVFGIVGVQLFAGRLDFCTDGSVAAIAQCTGTFVHPDTALPMPRVWRTERFSFDHIGAALVTLCEVASLKWLHILAALMDVTDVGVQPRRNASPGNALYLVAFVLLGSFFVMQLFIGVLVRAAARACGGWRGCGLGGIAAHIIRRRHAHGRKRPVFCAGTAACSCPFGAGRRADRDRGRWAPGEDSSHARVARAACDGRRHLA